MYKSTAPSPVKSPQAAKLLSLETVSPDVNDGLVLKAVNPGVDGCACGMVTQPTLSALEQFGGVKVDGAEMPARAAACGSLMLAAPVPHAPPEQLWSGPKTCGAVSGKGGYDSRPLTLFATHPAFV